MDNDGTKEGFAVEIIKDVEQEVNIPIIASGGAGKKEDFSSLFQQTKVSAGLAASIFHFSKVAIPDLKQFLIQQKISIRYEN